MAELLLELFSEEIPARMQDRAADQLKNHVLSKLKEYALEASGVAQSFATPRRLCLAINGIPSQQPDRSREVRGPRVDAPPAAIEGFKRSFEDVESVDYQERSTPKGVFLYANVFEEGQSADTVISTVVGDVIHNLPWPKSMLWGDGYLRWIRPLHHVICLLDGEPVSLLLVHKRPVFDFFKTARYTIGHRFMASEPIEVRGFDDYVLKLRSAKVILDGNERRRLIMEQASKLAASEGFVVKPDEDLLDELKGLVEWPVALMGRIDNESMHLPPEVLTTSMRTHQRYLALQDGEGRLAPRFITVANIEAEDGGATIVRGNEYVLRARLWDARFFWEQDRKRPLEAYLPGLHQVVFHADLGTLGERIERLASLAKFLCGHVEGADRDLAQRAARLAKADLRTGMVGEFPELQGIMGGHYARAQGEDERVAQAIAEQYAPKGPDDRCPTAPESVVVALADKLDALAGFFAADIRPTGSKDPFALRRAALGVIRLVLENGLRLPLRHAFDAALDGYEERYPDRRGAATVELLRFFADRLRVHLRGEGARHDLVSAVFAAGEEDDLVRLVARVEALGAFLATDDGRNLLTAYRRASSIVGIEEKKDKRRYDGAPDPALLREPADRALHEALLAALGRIDAALAAEDYAGAMAAVAGLRAPVDAFFEGVMVNAEDQALRANRLRLLGLIRSALGRVADFGLIEDAGT